VRRGDILAERFDRPSGRGARVRHNSAARHPGHAAAAAFADSDRGRGVDDLSDHESERPMSISRLCSLFSLVALTGLSACGGGGSDGPAPTPAAPAPTPIPPAPYATCSDAGKAVAAASAATNNAVCMLTTQGEIVVELYPDKAPITVANFLQYVAAKRYDNTLYHRVVNSSIFVVQGGGYTTDGVEVTAYPMIKIENDKGLSNVRGTIAMARLPSANPDTATSQFFFNTADNSACLDAGKKTNGCDPNGYAVFGKVIAGLDTMDKIAGVPLYSNGLPVTRVVTYWAEQLK
jgi:peptidyl-prolyl cis-trans isomerase A (cyclophilin A)